MRLCAHGERPVNGVQQSGSVTPFHLAVWSTDGVLQDGGPITAAQKVIGSLFQANFNSPSADQAILISTGITAFMLTGIVVTNASVSLTTAQGGFYSQVNQGGSVIVASGQVYSSLTTPNLLLQPTLTNFAQTARFSSANLTTTLGPSGINVLQFFLNLTAGQGAAATADVYALGIDLTP